MYLMNSTTEQTKDNGYDVATHEMMANLPLTYEHIILFARQLSLEERVRLVRDILAEPIIVCPQAVSQHSVLDIINSAPGQRLFKTAAEIDAYIKQERDSWDI